MNKTTRSQRQTIMAFRDPFKLVPINNIAEIADKFTRNEILTSNEIRQIIGFRPSKDPKADQLVNSNIAQSKDETPQTNVNQETEQTEEPKEDEKSGLAKSFSDIPISELMNV